MFKTVMKTAAHLYESIGGLYLTPVLLMERKLQRSARVNERPVEYAFVFDCLARICPAEVLDVGSGRAGLPHLMATCGLRVTAVDKMDGYWKGQFVNRHYYVAKDDITQSKIKKQFDLVTCISVLEHIPDHEAAFRGMFQLLKPGGHLLITCPYNESRYVENVYALPGAGYGQNAAYVCQVYSRNEINAWLKQNPGEIVRQEYYQIFAGDLWTFGGRIHPFKKVAQDEKHHLTCILIRKAEQP